jgi:DNA polymerase-3 subunit alpha
VNKRVFEALVKSGACDSLQQDDPSAAASPQQVRTLRARLHASIDAACEHGGRMQRNRDLGQEDLFGRDESGTSMTVPAPLPDAPSWSEIEQLNYEKEALGLYWSGHPVDRFAEDLRLYGAKTTGDVSVRKEPLAAADESDEAVATVPSAPGRVAEDVSIGGIVSGLRPLKTRKGDRMCVFMLEDASGTVEVVVFPDAFRQFGHVADDGQMVLVKGRLERDDESARILASEIVPIDLVRERLATQVAIRLATPPHDRHTFERLWDLFAQHKGDRPVAFDIELQAPSRRLRVTIDVNSQIRVRPSQALVAEVEKICGAGSVSLR